MQLILDITGVSVNSFHSDLSTITGERVIVFKLDDNLEKHFKINNIKSVNRLGIFRNEIDF